MAAVAVRKKLILLSRKTKKLLLVFTTSSKMISRVMPSAEKRDGPRNLSVLFSWLLFEESDLYTGFMMLFSPFKQK